ncbi:MAG: cyclic nucleotide-binding domain-containing protein [Pseudomonadota bacterium]
MLNETIAINWVDGLSYLGSALLVLSFSMKTILPLRLAALAASAVFLLYAFSKGLWVLLALHTVLLLLNLYRIGDHRRALRRVQSTADSSVQVETLVPLMQHLHCPSGTVLFLKGDKAERIYYLGDGAVDIPEVGKTLGPGTLFGEVGLFTPDQTRTASAVCAEDCDLMVISDRDIVRHCMKDPAFGLYLTKLIAGRMAENQG